MSFISRMVIRKKGCGFRHSPRYTVLAAAVIDESGDSYKEQSDANAD
jgi:hypothetical protein